MTRRMFRSLSLRLVVFASLITFHQTALAGPPLICHPFEIGDAKSLPWAGSAWRAVKVDYDIDRLVDDTLALLSSETAPLVRMETLRRATVYSVWAMRDYKVGYPIKDLKIANELLSRLRARAESAKEKGQAEALALFDLGYFIETYQQAAWSLPQDMNLARDLDGYASVVKAIELTGGDPEMEFAAAVITSQPERKGHHEHLQKAVARAREGSWLAKNLTSHFGDRGAQSAEQPLDLSGLLVPVLGSLLVLMLGNFLPVA